MCVRTWLQFSIKLKDKAVLLPTLLDSDVWCFFRKLTIVLEPQSFGCHWNKHQMIFVVISVSFYQQFSGLIGLIFILELTVAVLAIVFQSQVREWINEFFIVNIKAYRDDIDLQNLIDSLQKMVTICFTFDCEQIPLVAPPSLFSTAGTLKYIKQSLILNLDVLYVPPFWLRTFDFPQQNHCCGAQEPDDWNHNVYFRCNETHLSREKCGVPFSCCISDPAVS